MNTIEVLQKNQEINTKLMNVMFMGKDISDETKRKEVESVSAIVNELCSELIELQLRLPKLHPKTKESASTSIGWEDVKKELTVPAVFDEDDGR